MNKAGTERDAELCMVNRNAVVLEPAEAYLQWTKSLPDADPELTLEGLTEEGTVYLIPGIDAYPDAWLKRNFKTIFEQELVAWYTDPAFWPRDRSFKAFKKFFKVQFCSIVFDMCNYEIEKDE